MIDISTPVSYSGPKPTSITGPTYGFALNLGAPKDSGLPYRNVTFIPKEVLEKGIVQGDTQFYSPYLLSVYNDTKPVNANDISFRRENQKEEFLKDIERFGYGTEGVLVPNHIITEDYNLVNVIDTWNSYRIGDVTSNGVQIGPIIGALAEDGKMVYNVQASGQPGAYARATAESIIGTYNIPGKKWYETPLGKVGIALGAATGLGALGIGPLAAGGAASGAAGGAALGTGLVPGAAGATGLTAGAAGVTGLTAPAGFALAPGIGAGAAGLGILDAAQFGQTGQTGITPGAAGQGLQTPTTPGLSSMGGGTGLTVPVEGGTVSQLGFVPGGATPVLGDPSSFINNPNVLDNTVFTTDKLMAPGAATGISATDALRLANQARGLLGAGQNPIIPQQQGLPQQAGGSQGVDYSGLLSLLQLQAGTPGVSSLTQPAQLRPMYQTTLLPNVLSLLG